MATGIETTSGMAAMVADGVMVALGAHMATHVLPSRKTKWRKGRSW
jgi:hypothetical protein